MEQMQQPKMNLNLNDGRDIICDCKGKIFIPGYRFRKFSRLLTGEANDSILPIELFLCANCGKPLEDLLPKELKEEGKSQKIEP